MRQLIAMLAVLAAGSATAAAHDAPPGSIEIDVAACSALQRHVAAADVNYAPGTDVNGNAVAPADLDASGGIQPPAVIRFQLTLDLAARLGLPADYLARPVIGDIAIGADGRVTFNGTPLTSDAQYELAQKCGQTPPPR